MSQTIVERFTRYLIQCRAPRARGVSSPAGQMGRCPETRRQAPTCPGHTASTRKWDRPDEEGASCLEKVQSFIKVTATTAPQRPFAIIALPGPVSPPNCREQFILKWPEGVSGFPQSEGTLWELSGTTEFRWKGGSCVLGGRGKQAELSGLHLGAGCGWRLWSEGRGMRLAGGGVAGGLVPSPAGPAPPPTAPHLPPTCPGGRSTLLRLPVTRRVRRTVRAHGPPPGLTGSRPVFAAHHRGPAAAPSLGPRPLPAHGTPGHRVRSRAGGEQPGRDSRVVPPSARPKGPPSGPPGGKPALPPPGPVRNGSARLTPLPPGKGPAHPRGRGIHLQNGRVGIGRLSYSSRSGHSSLTRGRHVAREQTRALHHGCRRWGFLRRPCVCLQTPFLLLSRVSLQRGQRGQRGPPGARHP